MAYLTQIHEYKGQQNLFIEAKADALSNLLEAARIQSTEASNRIEGIIITDDRLRKIVREKTMPQTRSESEIMAKCPDISQITVQRALAELLKSGEITKLSGGRYTAYVWSGEE